MNRPALRRPRRRRVQRRTRTVPVDDRAGTAAAAAEETAETEGAVSRAGAEADAAPRGRYGSMLSPAVPITNRFVNTGTNAPSSKKVARIMPPAGGIILA